LPAQSSHALNEPSPLILVGCDLTISSSADGGRWLRDRADRRPHDHVVAAAHVVK
jgi:hypothetical protein